MKVKDILPRKEKLENELKNLQHLEKLFSNDLNLSEEIGEKADCNIPVYMLITESRMRCAEELFKIKVAIENAEISNN